MDSLPFEAIAAIVHRGQRLRNCEVVTTHGIVLDKSAK